MTNLLDNNVSPPSLRLHYNGPPHQSRSYETLESADLLPPLNNTSISNQLVSAWQQHDLPSNEGGYNSTLLSISPSYGSIASVYPSLTTVSNIVGNNDGSDTQDYMAFYDNAQFVTGLICYPIICCLGLIGNSLILLVLGQMSMRTSTNVYLSALAVSDIIKLINDLLYFFTVLFSKLHPETGNKMFGYLYPYAHFIFNMAVCIAAWLTVSVAVERYILVCHPTRSKGVITISRAKIISALCYIVMTALAIPSAFRYQTVTIQTTDEQGQNITKLDVTLSQLWENRQFVISYTWLQSLLRSIIPLFILVVMNAFIINALRKTRANKKNASRNRITVMLIIVIIFFLVCITPDAIMSAFFNFGYTESTNYLVKGIREITVSREPIMLRTYNAEKIL